MKHYLALVMGFVLAACTNTVSVERLENVVPAKATVLMSVEEGFVLKAGKAFVGFDGPEYFAVASLAASNGGPGRADVISRNRIVSYAALQTEPGTYRLDRWRFQHRRGVSLPLQNAATVTLEPGTTYYLGRFVANNLTQTARIIGMAEDDLPLFRQKHPVIADVEIEDASAGLETTCWSQDVTARIAGESEALARAVADCFPE